MIERTARELLEMMAQGETSAEAVLQSFFESIHAREPRIGAFLSHDKLHALDQACAIDRLRRRGEPLGPLAGIPVAVKDVLCHTSGLPTTCGSKMLRDFRPPYDATAVARILQAGAIVVGKTNLDEFAMGSSCENSAYKLTRNPWDQERIPGGSSGGSAAAVAACMAPLSLGTDTGGSIRLPASLCGVVGLKPSYGRVSRFGQVAYGSSLDQIGPFAHDVRDAALVFEAIAGHDPRDSTSIPEPPPRITPVLDIPVAPLTIGVPREYFGDGLDAEVAQNVREALKVYAALGATLKDLTLPHTQYAVATYYLVATAEASSNLARYDGVHYGHRAAKFDDLMDMVCKSRGEGFGREVKRRIMLGTYALSSGYIDAYYLKALKVRRLIKEDFDKAFAQCDVIMGPTSPTPAFKIGAKADDPLAMYLSDIYTISANLAGLPGISIPCGFTKSKLPIGLQILAPPLAEEKLLRVARMFEKETDWHARRPELHSP